MIVQSEGYSMRTLTDDSSAALAQASSAVATVATETLPTRPTGAGERAVGERVCDQLLPFGYGRFVLSAGSEELGLLENSTSIRGHNNTSTIRTAKR